MKFFSIEMSDMKAENVLCEIEVTPENTKVNYKKNGQRYVYDKKEDFTFAL